MNQGIVELSHEINNTGTAVPQSTYLAPPKTPPTGRLNPPPTKRAEAEKKKMEKISEEEFEKRRKQELRVKIEQYLGSPVLKCYFEDSPIKAPSEQAPLEAFEACYQLIKKVITWESKRMVVDNLFETVLEMGQEGAENFLGLNCRLPDGRSFADFCLHPQVKQDMFQPELEEISIEISDWMVPDPKIRLMFKIFKAYKTFKQIREVDEQKEAYEKLNQKEEKELPNQSESSSSSSSSSKSSRPQKKK